jgi:1,4-dihydroxy-2-naphthoyl-CoA hydrolase
VTNVPNQPDRWRLPYEDTLDACIGLEIDELVEVGVRTARLPVVPRVCQPMGIVHGGTYAAIAESLASMGTADGVIALGKVPLGMSNNTSFLRPVS